MNSKPEEERTKYLESIKIKYLTNQLSKIKAHWYESWESIASSHIKDWEKPEYERTILFLNADLKTLIEKQDSSRKVIFNYQTMYNPRRYDHRTSSILDAWIHGIPILPPRVKISESEHLIISDGLHRTNAALCLKETTIPILVENHEIVKYGLDNLYQLGELEMATKNP